MFSDYTIPKDTVLYGVTRFIQRDPDYWNEPEEFRPERFIQIDSDTGLRTLKKEDRLVPFGAGEKNHAIQLTSCV